MKTSIAMALVSMVIFISVASAYSAYAEPLEITDTETTTIGVRVIGNAPADPQEFMKNNNELGLLWKENTDDYYADCGEVVDLNGNGIVEAYPWYSECRIVKK